MLAAIIARMGIPFLVSVVGEALGRIDNKAAQSASKSLENFQGAWADGAISPEQMAEANRHAEKMAEVKAQEDEAALSEINQSLRLETSSNDAYVRRMRPTFGYLMAITWAAQMMGLAYVLTFETEKAPPVLQSMEALSTIWAVGLSVLGIYVYKRSEEKKVTVTPPSIKVKAETVQTPTQKTTNISARIPASAPKVNQ